MSYEVVNKELMIEACKIEDLTAGQVIGFLKLWDDDSSINTLTLFAKKDGTVVLNKDNAHYELYKDLTEGYLKADENIRKAFKIPKGSEETINILERVIKQREFNKIVDPVVLERLQDVRPYSEVSKIIDAVKERYSACTDTFQMLKMFKFGYVYGKREEREKKKKVGKCDLKP